MTDTQRREAARQFYYRWNGKGKEDEDARSYWIEILTNILGVDRVTERVDFEKKVIGPDGNTKRIDVYIPETHVLIEQKSLGVPLDKAQSGHDGMTPYEQAKMYDNGLPFSERARWIVTSNFAEIWIYDREENKPEPIKLTLADLMSKYPMLDFLINKETKTITDEMKVSLAAGELVGKIYDALLKQYKNPDDPGTLISLNKLCVRLVFCLYAEDACVFSDTKKNVFHEYMKQFTPAQARVGLKNLFRVLNQKPQERDPYLADDDPLLAAFPYVNGGLFEDDDIEIPPFTEEIMDLLLTHASDEFDWSDISPTIFGAVFESTLNPVTRREGGMHYTSIENIHKVIDPLFLDELKAELEEIKKIAVEKTRDKRFREFQDKLTTVVCLDPAAGSGNFLTESYLCLRKIENEVIGMLQHGQMGMADQTVTPIKVSIAQFYGIEINDFAVTVAKTALWIAEIQMMRETAWLLSIDPSYLPLKTNANIVEANALRIDWADVVPKDKLRYIMGNPPFVGFKYSSPEQKSDMQLVFSKDIKTALLDYVCCWYKKAAEYIQETRIEVAFVSTNSVSQGQMAADLWSYLLNKYHVVINYAYQSFVWESESSLSASVHVVIICFSVIERKEKTIFSHSSPLIAKNINPYLIDGNNTLINSRRKPLYDIPEMIMGNQAMDGGNLIIEEEDYDGFIKQEPKAIPYIKRYMMGYEFINNKKRYCLWLVNCPPETLKSMPLVMKRIQAVQLMRSSSNDAGARKKADTPTLFREQRNPDHFIAVPIVSSERRRYIPMGYLDNSVIAGNKLFIVPDASVYHFGVLSSNVHMSWVRTVAARLKSDYTYSKDIVYNNFPWPDPTPAQKEKIGQTAQAILDARALYPDSSLADLYDPLTMPPELLKAHQANDRAVMQAYGMPIKETDEAACVAWLMRLYQKKVEELNQK
ncbi:MAG: methylase [Clostridiales bacterium]|nr:methylase [Clostridiales bacterium]